MSNLFPHKQQTLHIQNGSLQRHNKRNGNGQQRSKDKRADEGINYNIPRSNMLNQHSREKPCMDGFNAIVVFVAPSLLSTVGNFNIIIIGSVLHLQSRFYDLLQNYINRTKHLQFSTTRYDDRQKSIYTLTSSGSLATCLYVARSSPGGFVSCKIFLTANVKMRITLIKNENCLIKQKYPLGYG
uniref:Uncharacterized protein n=1 Tax=Glossina austeni TaxID=7395 RepID=A0A1A9VGS3_GLOAU